MIYGYDECTVNEFGLKRMREVSIAASPEALRRLADFLQDMTASWSETPSRRIGTDTRQRT